jgi:hypothetical protein
MEMLELPKGEAESRSEPVCEDMQFQRRNWLAERVSWNCMAMFCVVALLGLFDGTRQSVSSPRSNLRVEYTSPVRATTETEFKIARPSQGITVDLPVGHKMVRAVPSPAAVRREGARQFLVFPSSAAGEISLTLQPSSPGSVIGSISAADDQVSFQQFILP